jgi:hypothetical protein
VVIARSNFEDNVAAGYGGAIALTLQGKVVTQDCNFIGNKGATGGAMSVGGTTVVEPNVVVIGGSFVGNKAVTIGGGIIANVNSFLVVNGTAFVENKVGRGTGGGIATSSNAVVSISHSMFVKNSVLGDEIGAGSNGLQDGRGGAIFLDGAVNDTRNEVLYSEFNGNLALDGGALALGVFASVRGCNFTANNAGFRAEATSGTETSVDIEGGSNSCNVNNGFGAAIYAFAALSSSIEGQACREAIARNIMHISGSSFSRNRCQVAGTVYWSFLSSDWRGSCAGNSDFCADCVWVNNTALGYGSNAATSPAELSLSDLPTEVFPGVQFQFQLQGYDALGTALKGGHESVDVSIKVEQNSSEAVVSSLLVSSSLANGELQPNFRLIGQPLSPFVIDFESSPTLLISQSQRKGALSLCPPGQDFLPEFEQCKRRCSAGIIRHKLDAFHSSCHVSCMFKAQVRLLSGHKRTRPPECPGLFEHY